MMEDRAEEMKIRAFGKLLLGMLDEMERVDAEIPDGFEPEEISNTIQTADGRMWEIVVRFAEGDDE